ncbi:M15 family metallopeptidase [Tomitella gaofuii]|uniref:M15 family metallopeptidase n=1 Tax=Tomitella gaofuii TaxID=2760083 RepID=UPI001F2F5EDC|nr:M15 family metallopeptidase [Tomitella gaofuii]
MEVRAGIAATILNAWVAWYHANVESVDRYKPRDYWGWSATNDVWNSNHLSGTAVDLCATQYPWGLRTMPEGRRAKIREGLRLFEGTIFWGADWGRADEMHYQLNYPEGDARNAAFVKKLEDGYLGIYGPGGGSGEEVAGLAISENRLRELIYECLETFVGPIGSDVKDCRQQLTGARNDFEGYPGFPHGGKRTLYDVAVATAEKSGVPGCHDTAPGKGVE